MHRANNMVGARPANYNVSLFSRYFRMAKHREPGRLRKSLISAVIALEISLGVTVYA